MAKLDDASWHLDSEDFPDNAPEENAATHIGMFVAWTINNDLWGQFDDFDWSTPAQQVRNREISGRTFLLELCDGKLFTEMLTEDGAAFADWYYDQYLEDCQRVLSKDLESDYLVEDTWENYERIAAVITGRYRNPRPKPKPWWKFWG